MLHSSKLLKVSVLLRRLWEPEKNSWKDWVLVCGLQLKKMIIFSFAGKGAIYKQNFNYW